jgi:hypothetical protein
MTDEPHADLIKYLITHRSWVYDNADALRVLCSTLGLNDEGVRASLIARIKARLQKFSPYKLGY